MSLERPTLPTIEITANIILWSVGVLYSLYQFYLTCLVLDNYEDTYNDFNNGWKFLNKRKDVSDEEWETILQLMQRLIPWLIIHTACSEISKQYKTATQLIISFIFLCIYMNLIIACLLLFQLFIFHIFSKFKSVLMLWLCCILCLSIITWYKLADLEWLEINEMQHVVSIMAVFWINLRCLSFYLDLVRLQDDRSIIDLIAYAFYLPTLYTGPFLSFDDYKNSLNSINTPPFQQRLLTLIKNLARFLFWIAFTECALHYIYVNAMTYHVELVERFEAWSMYGYGYAMGQFFHLKYVIMYGVSTAFAKFDGCNVPGTPKCIGRIHLYSDMWKYFDEGLYKFLLRYIYLPTLRRKRLPNKLFSSFLCFTFVYVWHGIQNYILIWTALNFLGVTIENTFKAFYKSCNIDISKQWARRLGALIAAPLLAISAMTNFYFFAGTSIGNVFFYKFFTSTFKTNFILIMLLYCCCQTSIEVKLSERKAVKAI